MKKAIFTTIPFLLLAACAPKVETRQFEAAKTDFKPNHEDVDLLGKYESLQFQGRFDFSGSFAHGSLYRFSENVFSLGKALDKPLLMDLGVKTRNRLQEKSEKNIIASEKTTYVDFLISKSKAPVMEALGKIDEDLKSGETEVVALVKDFNDKFSTDAANPVDLQTGIAYMKDYLRQLNQKIGNKNIMPELKSGLQDELKVKIGWLDTLETKIGSVLAEGNTFPMMLDRLFVVLDSEKIELPADVQPLIEQAKSLGEGLRSCQTPQEAMTVIVDVWLLLGEEERELYFKEVSEDLYKELQKSGKKTLACLRDEECKSFFKNLKKNLFILPALKKFGPEKICQEIDVNAQKFVRDLLKVEIAKVLANAPQSIPDEVKKAIMDKRNELKKITGDYDNFFRTRFATWAASKNLKSINLKTQGRKDISLKGEDLSMSDAEASDLDTFEALGPAISATVMQADLKSSYEMLARITSISDIVLSDENVKGQPISKEFRNANQAETLRGLSQAIRFFRDFESSEFDNTLGKIMAQDLIPDMDLGENNQALFPKQDLYALSIATAAQFIENLQSTKSPLFTMGIDKKITWLDKKEEATKMSEQVEESSPQVLAGIVEMKNGERASNVKTAHLARWILAASEFLAAIQDAEKSSSVDLREKGADGVVPLDKLATARQDLRQLILGLSNFLSHELVDERGLFAASYDIASLKRSPTNEVSVLDQALAIRALLAASETLSMETYRFAAIDGYYKMNLHLFYPKERFYKNTKNDQKTQLPVVVETLRTLQVLEPHLPSKSADQIRWIMAPWIKGLENLKL